MATHDGVPAEEPLDPVYASLFRPGTPDDGPAAPPAQPTADDPAAEPSDPLAPVEPLAQDPPAAAPTTTAADTGRLFRSQGATGHETAVLAIDHGRRLRTLERSEVPTPTSIPVTAVVGPAAVEEAGLAPTPVAAEVLAGSAPSRLGGRRQISAGAVYLLVFGVTLLVAFADALIFGGELGWPTGIALVASSVYCALTVRREDDVVAIIVPPLAFLLAALTAGQLFRGPTAGDVLNRAQLVFFTLAYNWYWVIGATLLALIIVLVRRRR